MIRMVLLMIFLSLASLTSISHAEPETPQFLSDSKNVKQHLNDKAKLIFDILIFTVVVVGGLAYAVAGGLLATGRPQEARSLGINVTVAFVFIGLIGGIVSLIL